MTSRPQRFQSNKESFWQARVDLAAALRWAQRFGYSEGVCNHFSVAVPGATDRFLLNPRGLHWSEIRASDLIVVDLHGTVLEGRYEAEPTAFHIHSQIHLSKPEARCVLHTHMPYATALCCIEGHGLKLVSQNALRFYGRIAYDEGYAGEALDEAEASRICAALRSSNSDNGVLFLANHGVIVTGEDVAVAFDDLYYLERACMHQILAQSTGQPFRIIPDTICRLTARQIEGQREQSRLHFEALKRVLAREEPSYST